MSGRMMQNRCLIASAHDMAGWLIGWSVGGWLFVVAVFVCLFVGCVCVLFVCRCVFCLGGRWGGGSGDVTGLRAHLAFQTRQEAHPLPTRKDALSLEPRSQ